MRGLRVPPRHSAACMGWAREELWRAGQSELQQSKRQRAARHCGVPLDRHIDAQVRARGWIR